MRKPRRSKTAQNADKGIPVEFDSRMVHTAKLFQLINRDTFEISHHNTREEVLVFLSKEKRIKNFTVDYKDVPLEF